MGIFATFRIAYEIVQPRAWPPLAPRLASLELAALVRHGKPYFLAISWVINARIA